MSQRMLEYTVASGVILSDAALGAWLFCFLGNASVAALRIPHLSVSSVQLDVLVSCSGDRKRWELIPESGCGGRAWGRDVPGRCHSDHDFVWQDRLIALDAADEFFRMASAVYPKRPGGDRGDEGPRPLQSIPAVVP